MKVQTERGWEDVCDTHYDSHFRAVADKNCQAMGLARRPGESPQNSRLRVSAWIKERAARLADRMAS
jgi:hypothetical protein